MVYSIAESLKELEGNIRRLRQNIEEARWEKAAESGVEVIEEAWMVVSEAPDEIPELDVEEASSVISRLRDIAAQAELEVECVHRICGEWSYLTDDPRLTGAATRIVGFAEESLSLVRGLLEAHVAKAPRENKTPPADTGGEEELPKSGQEI